VINESCILNSAQDAQSFNRQPCSFKCPFQLRAHLNEFQQTDEKMRAVDIFSIQAIAL